MKDKKAFWFWILLPLIVGGLSGIISKNGMDVYNETAIKPVLSPPPILFPIVWTILYLLMGYCAYRIYTSESLNRRDAIIAFGVQLGLNFIWSPVFFILSAYTIGSIILVALAVAIVIMIITFCKIDKTAGLLQLPYLLWTCFALYLNIATDMLNK